MTDGILLTDTVLDSGRRMNKRCFRSYSFCVSDENSEHRRFVKIVTKLSCRDGSCSVWREIGKSLSAFLDGDTTAKELFREVLKADRIGECCADFFTELVFVGFKLRLLDRQALLGENGVFFVQDVYKRQG